jgi:ABC-type hemin transport system substrate-binding protein
VIITATGRTTALQNAAARTTRPAWAATARGRSDRAEEVEGLIRVGIGPRIKNLFESQELV